MFFNFRTVISLSVFLSKAAQNFLMKKEIYKPTTEFIPERSLTLVRMKGVINPSRLTIISKIT
jgi:hypothetical protein